MPKIGPISGETSMAPIITAVELTLRPTEARTMAQTRIHTFGPLKKMLLRMFSAAFSVSICSRMSAISLIIYLKLLIILIFSLV